MIFTPIRKKSSFCNQHHFSNRCEQFLSKTIPERKELIKSSNLCFNCLGKHNVKSCTSTYRCFLCKAKHHTMVHTDNNQVISSSQTGQIGSVSSTSSQNCGNFVISEDIQSAHQAVSLKGRGYRRGLFFYFYTIISSKPHLLVQFLRFYKLHWPKHL